MTGAEPASPAAEATEPIGNHLLGHLLRFGQLLHRMGVETSLRQMLDLVQALDHVPITERLNFYYVARALLVTRHEDWPIFDQAFELFWCSIDSPPNDRKGSEKQRRARLPGEPGAADDKAREQDTRCGPGTGESQMWVSERAARYSPMEILRHKDFGQMPWEEIQEAKHAIAGLKWKLARRKTRRYERGVRGRLDLRQVMRRSLALGGEMLDLSFRTRALRPRPLVVLCDVSGSMDRYSRMLLHFIHALMHGLTGVDVEAFVFGTRLTRITHHLHHKDVDDALDEVSQAVLDWSSGTRIGEAIKAFNFHWARRVLGRGAAVLVISDGWDRGELDLLTCELGRLQRSCHRLMWLNPLVGAKQYEPSQRGMAAALGYIDDFLPGCNLANLEQLAEILTRLPTNRPRRRQRPCLPAENQPLIAPGSERLEEHPFVKVLDTYPWLDVFTDLGRMNNRKSNPER